MNTKALIPSLLAVLFITFANPAVNASSDKVVSDSLVENLACSRISTEEIYRRIRPEAFASQYHNLSVSGSRPYLTKYLKRIEESPITDPHGAPTRHLESHRMTLLVLRPTRLSQHVVIAKSFRLLSNGRTEIVVYDSNQPLREMNTIAV